MSSSFRVQDCIIPEIWCGDKNTPPKKKDKIYYKIGTRYECMKKGIGAGMHIERNESLPIDSLQQIKYVGEKHELAFKRAGIKTISSLIREMKGRTSKEMEVILKKILSKSDGVVDGRAYNHVVLYLYKHGIANVPQCKKIRVTS